MRWGDEWIRHDDPPTHLIDEATGARIEPILLDLFERWET
jgi:hypothetical protein